MSLDPLQHLTNKMQEEIRVISDDLASGTAKDFGDYRHAAGIIRGLMIASSIIADMAKQYEESE